MIEGRRLALVALLLVACDQGRGSDARRELARGDAQVGGDVVSTVDGHPITVADVEQAAREAGVSPRRALRALQDELLLARAAERAGFDEARGVERARRQSAVQALLERAVEAEVGPDQIDPAALEAELDANRTRFDQPERRHSVHLLASLGADAPASVEAAAEAWIREKHLEIAAAPAAEAALLALRRGLPTDLPFEVRVEEVPALDRASGADAAYLNAIFSRPDVGLVTEPVRTSYGWHVIAVTEIEPAWQATHEEALATLGSERLVSLRADALEALIRRLASEQEIVVERETVSRVISDPAFLPEAR